MLNVGMRLPRKSRDKTRTLHTCVCYILCDLKICCVHICLVNSIRGSVESFGIFTVYKTGTKRRNENKFHKFIWFRGEGNNFLRFYKL